MKMTLSLFLVFVLALTTLPLISPQGTARAESPRQQTVYFAGGCFWGVEHMMSLVPGVTNARSGYANGSLENPDYRTVVTGTTGHRETVEVTFRPDLVSLTELVELFFSAIDPTVENRQGNDIGTQYQTGVYYVNEEDGALIRELAEKEAAKHKAYYVEIEPLDDFWEAEDYHQDYLIKNPGGYCHLGLDDFERARRTGKKDSPRVAEYRQISPSDAYKRMESGENILLVDVREPYEFGAGHIKGAINLPLGSLDQLAPEHMPDKDAVIFLYCRSGNRSRTAVNYLVSQGYTNVYDLGGIISWPYGVE